MNRLLPFVTFSLLVMTPMDAPVAAGSSEQDIEITELSLQELMSLDLVVTTAAKKA